MLLPDDERVYAFGRRLGDVELLVLANLSSDPVTLGLPDAAAWTGSELLLGNLTGEPPPTDLELRPWEARVHRRTI